MIELETAVRYFGSNKKRVMLSVIGIAIGVFSLTFMMGLTGAMRSKVIKSLGELGSQVIVIIPGDVKVMGGRVLQLSFYPTLKLKEARIIEQKCPSVRLTSPFKKVSPNVHANGKAVDASVMGVNENYELITDFHPSCGRFISRSDVENISEVAVIGKNVASELFGNPCPVGRTIFLFNAPYRVVGVMEPKGTDASGKNLDNMVFIPITSAVKRISNVDYIDGIYVLPVSENLMRSAMEETESLLLKLHGRKDFSVNAYEDLINVQKQAMDIFTVLSVTVAVIAFSVGGLGILAVMTLSVYERLIEIGIRRAFGARRRDVFRQFLTESALLSISGSTIGVVLATALVVLISKVAGWEPIYIPLKGMLISFSLSTAIGVLSGIYPAFRATSFETREILREA